MTGVQFPDGYGLLMSTIQFPGWPLEATKPDPRSSVTFQANVSFGFHVPFLLLWRAWYTQTGMWFYLWSAASSLPFTQEGKAWFPGRGIWSLGSQMRGLGQLQLLLREAPHTPCTTAASKQLPYIGLSDSLKDCSTQLARSAGETSSFGQENASLIVF